MYNITWGRSIETSSPSAKAAPIAKPSARLWIPSPKITCKKYEYSYVDFWKEEDTHHPGHTWYIFWSRMKMGVSMAVPMVGHLLRRWSWSWWWPWWLWWRWWCPWWATCQEEDADHDDHDNHNHNDNGEDGYDDNNDHDDDNVIQMNEWMWREKKLPHAGK